MAKQSNKKLFVCKLLIGLLTPSGHTSPERSAKRPRNDENTLSEQKKREYITSGTDFPAVFEELKKILKPYAAKLTLTADTSEGYSLDGPYSEKWKKAVFFGAVQVKKNYVSFYLMPVYMFPDLLQNISPELKKRMQGKSCFNFKRVESDLFNELNSLTRKSVDRFIKEN